MSTVVTQKGQATIPKPIRDLLGLAAGSKIDFIPQSDGSVRIVRSDVESPPRPARFAALRGSATVRMGTDEILALTRGEV
jgi:antitoxin PrlF